MGLKGKMVRKVEIKSDGDIFLENFRYNPQHFSHMSPGNIRNVDFSQGDCGTVGSVIVWHYNQGMKTKSLHFYLPFTPTINVLIISLLFSTPSIRYFFFKIVPRIGSRNKVLSCILIFSHKFKRYYQLVFKLVPINKTLENLSTKLFFGFF